jgi:uncharacterized protein YjiS (DUF1127 family)
MTQAILTAHSFVTQGVEGFIDLMKSINEKRIERKAIRMTEKELAMLSNAELDDIGICRGDIYSIARTSVVIDNAKTNNNLRGWV